MLKYTIMFAAVAGLVLALAPPAQAQVSFATGFEAGEVPPWYNGAPAGVSITGQDNWAVQFGTGFRGVYTYAGSAVSWAPPSVGAWVDYAAPPHPSGGEQFFGTTGQGREWRNAAQNGPIVNCDVDFLNGPEHDYDGWQGAMTSRGDWFAAGPGNMAGFYTSVGSDYVAPPDPPRGGSWAPTWQVYDKYGVKLVNQGLGWRYDNLLGFDLLPRETWFRLGYSYDPVSRRYTEFRSDNLIDLLPGWSITDPQALYDYGLGAGPELVDLYILGGSPTDGIAPDNAAIADAIGLYNVGNGQVHLWDNVVVDNVPEPATMALLAFGGLGLLLRRRRR